MIQELNRCKQNPDDQADQRDKGGHGEQPVRFRRGSSGDIVIRKFELILSARILRNILGGILQRRGLFRNRLLIGGKYGGRFFFDSRLDRKSGG